MNLLDRYKRLSLWNKLFVWSACCSIVSLILFFIWPSTGASTRVVLNNSPGAKVATAINSSNTHQIVADTVNLIEVNQKADYGRLREVANIHGDGQQWTMMGASFYQHGPSVIWNDLARVVTSGTSSSRADAIKALLEITHKMPEWPFAYCYLGEITHQAEYLEEAVKRCTAIRDVGINEPSILLCEAVSLSLLGRYEPARDRLSEIGKNAAPDMMRMRFVAISPETPSDIADRIKALTPNNWNKDLTPPNTGTKTAVQ